MSIGEIMLMSKENLARRVIADNRIEVYGCGASDIRSGVIDRRVMATLLYLAYSGLKPTVTIAQVRPRQHDRVRQRLRAQHGHGRRHRRHQRHRITPGSQGQGSITDLTIQRLLNLQGTMKPHQIISLMTFKGADNTLAMSDHGDHIHIGWRPLYGRTRRRRSRSTPS